MVIKDTREVIMEVVVAVSVVLKEGLGDLEAQVDIMEVADLVAPMADLEALEALEDITVTAVVLGEDLADLEVGWVEGLEDTTGEVEVSGDLVAAVVDREGEEGFDKGFCII
jgi:hypothetical protein